MVVVDNDSGATRVGRYAEPTMLGNNPNDDFTLPGDWSTGTFNIGYLYEYSVEFPTIYPTKTADDTTVSNTNGSLIIHRIKLNFGAAGMYTTTLDRLGKPQYSEKWEPPLANPKH